MSQVRVKICGITRLDDALAAVDSGADALGFNFWPDSKRHCSPKVAESIVRKLPPFVTVVGVFVNQARNDISRVAKRVRLSSIQLHGDESPRDCVGYTLPVIKALQMPVVGKDLKRFSAVSAFLLDAPSAGYGGSGRTFDWRMARGFNAQHRIILAGGLNPANVQRAIRSVRPFAVDVASGVESSPGIKDWKKMARFISKAKEVRR